MRFSMVVQAICDQDMRFYHARPKGSNPHHGAIRARLRLQRTYAPS
jgi:hypothetical protein